MSLEEQPTTPIKKKKKKPVTGALVEVRRTPPVVVEPGLADWEAEFRVEAGKQMRQELPSGGRVTWRAAQMKIDGTAVPGNRIRAFVLATAYVNTFYESAFDSDEITSPSCFAVGVPDETGFARLAPHANVQNPRARECGMCVKNTYGSADRGAGKACRNGRRLVLLPAPQDLSQLTAEEILSAPLYTAVVPPTGLKGLANYIRAAVAVSQWPLYGLVTEIAVAGDEKTQIRVDFTHCDTAGSSALMRALKERAADAEQLALVPYAPAREAPAPQEQVPGKFSADAPPKKLKKPARPS